jgi:thymidylate synthase, flavin-dependent
LTIYPSLIKRILAQGKTPVTSEEEQKLREDKNAVAHKTFKVLDKGYVRLIDSMGDDLSIVRAARVSFNAEWRAGENEKSDEKLLRYLWRNRHTSPFEAVTFTFEVKAPVFVFRQWHRHRTQSYNEVSARYTELPDEFYIPELEHIGTQSKDNKQARVIGLVESEVDGRQEELDEYEEHCKQSFVLYKKLLSRGWPRELARMNLPFSTYSHMFDTVNLLNLLKFLDLRLHPHAQYEIQVYAKAILDLIRSVVPVTHNIYTEAFKNDK